MSTVDERANAISELDGIVDLDRFPVDRLDDAIGQGFIDQCRNELAERGVCQLHGFLVPSAVTQMIAIWDDLRHLGWASDQPHTVYFEPPVTELDEQHPRAHMLRSAKKAIAYDLIPPAAPVRRLYESDAFTRFIASVLDKPVLHRSADPLDALEIATFEDGDELGWHFDRSEFSVTLMFQESTAGGEFDYCPSLRSDDEPNHDGVRAVLHGDDSPVLPLPTAPGTLAVFRGHHALHRVTPVAGGTPRINAVLTYGERPDMKLNELTQLLFYGRTG